MYFHTKPTPKKRRMTFKGQLSGNRLQIAISKCSKKDMFCKKHGRMIADGRMQKGKFVIDVAKDENMTTGTQFVQECIKYSELVNG